MTPAREMLRPKEGRTFCRGERSRRVPETFACLVRSNRVRRAKVGNAMSLSTAETYRFAAREHLERAFRLHENEDYFLAHFVAGLAVECHLRAYMRTQSNEFNARHDLRELAKEADFYGIVPRHREEEFHADFVMLNLRWRSNHRYYSRRQFLDYMTEIKAEFRESGDRWKNISRRLLGLAEKIIEQGEAKWNSK